MISNAYRKWYWAHREQALERARLWRSSHKELLSKIVRDWKDRNRERVRENKRRWKKTEKGHKSNIAIAHRRRSKGAIINRKIVEDIYTANIKKFGHLTCVYCNRSLDLRKSREVTLDHIVPVVKGGKTEKRNLVIACMKCNSAKSALSVKEFKRRLAA